MNDRINAIEKAREILTALPGWELDTDTLRAICERDGFGRHWAGISNPNFPGAEVSINTSHAGPSRLSITARYPKDWEPYLEGRGHTYTENITVSADKTPQQIARDIQKRLFEATGYLSHVAECMGRKQASNDAMDEAERVARELASLIGTTTEYDRHSKEDRERYSHLGRGDGRRQFELREDPPNYTRRVEGDVSQGGREVELKFPGLTVDKARRLLMAWKGVKP